MEDDDEDLELLRMAALKTLKPSNNRIEVLEVPMTQHTNPQPLPIHNKKNMYVRHPISIPPTAQHLPPNYVAGMPPVQHINEPYIPMGINPHWNENVPKYYAHGAPPRPTLPINMPPGPSVTASVQLSPRSAAFVMQNNSILEQRKRSPRNYARSPSPAYRPTAGRWRSISRSPSPTRNGSRSRSPAPAPRSRYNSRSPPPQKRVNRRSRSRSPLPAPRSRYNSRSPPQQKRVGRKSRSRSPIRNRPYQSLNGKWEGKGRRSPLSPGRQVNHRTSSPLLKKRSPVNQRPISPLAKKRSRSPVVKRSGSPLQKKRSRSPVKPRSKSPVNRGSNVRNRLNRNGKTHSSNSRAASPIKKRVKSESKSKSRSKTPPEPKKVEVEEKVKETVAEGNNLLFFQSESLS